MKRRVVALFFVLLFVASCSKDDGENIPIEKSPLQVTLMYFAGLDLNRYYDTNIVNAKSAIANGALGEYGALYYFLPTTTTDAKLFRLTEENGVCVESEIKVYDDISSITPEALTEVIGDVKLSLGADVVSSATMNLVWSSHAMGWILLDPTESRSTMSSYRYYDQGADEQLVPTRYVGLSGKDSEGAMDIADLKQAIDDSDTHFGYIIFDACLMSSVEALYRLRDCSDYIVASPSEVMAAGFPYNTVVPELFEDNGTRCDLEGVCQAYYDYYMNIYSSSSSYGIKSCGTVAMCVTSELEPLAAAFSNVTLEPLTTTQRSEIQVYDNLTDHAFFDLCNYVEVAGADEDGVSAFLTQFDITFPVECRLYTPEYVSTLGSSGNNELKYYSGVTTSEPSINSSYAEGWSSEPWVAASR